MCNRRSPPNRFLFIWIIPLILCCVLGIYPDRTLFPSSASCGGGRKERGTFVHLFTLLSAKLWIGAGNWRSERDWTWVTTQCTVLNRLSFMEDLGFSGNGAFVEKYLESFKERNRPRQRFLLRYFHFFFRSDKGTLMPHMYVCAITTWCLLGSLLKFSLEVLVDLRPSSGDYTPPTPKPNPWT